MKTPVKIYRLKITLEGIEPPIWRRIEIFNCSLIRLSTLIMETMGWESGHLCQFEIGKNRVGDPLRLKRGFFGPKILDWDQITLADLEPPEGQSLIFGYSYDFGDDWHHEIVLEDWFEPVAGVEYPICTAGARACPPTDIGGVPGYEELLEIFATPKHERRREMIQWLGKPFKPEQFSAKAVTKQLRERWRIMTQGHTYR